MWKWVLSISFLIYLIQTTECARILAIEPFPAKSHMVVFSAYTKELARRGHDVTVISPFPLSKPMPNYTDIDISKELEVLEKGVKGRKMYDMADFSPWQMAFMMWNIGAVTSEAFFQSPKVQEILKDKKGFDLVIVEIFMNEAVYGVASHFNAPLIGICPFGGFYGLNSVHGNSAPLSYVPNALLPFTDKMTFYERLINTLVSTLWEIGHQFYYLPKQDQIRKQALGVKSPNIWELEKLMSISLINNHVSLSYPRPLVPTLIEVGGLHVSRKINKLPNDIQKFIDDSPNGVIYFSMGSNLRSDEMPESTRDAFLSAFSELKQRVLWKWESDSLPGQPKNVKLGKWLPQQDILAHPNVLLFITHGGLLSAQESIYHGKPLVGIPVFGDQSLNMKKAEMGGYGITVELKNVTKTSILWAINKVLYTPSYQEEARKRSLLYRDQPETPLDRAIFWTEYVIRHKGAYHLQTQSKQLSCIQLYSIDIILLVIGVIFIILASLIFILKAICGNKKSENTSADKRKKRQ